MQREELARHLNLPLLPDYLERVDGIIVSNCGEPNFKRDIKKMLDRGGKRLRPALLIASASLSRQSINSRVLTAAAAVEMVHQASLAHDAISDEQLNQAQVTKALLTGDYLLALAFGLASEAALSAVECLSETIKSMAAGQAAQFDSKYATDPGSDFYLRAIQNKTASLFAAACKIGAVLADLDQGSITALCEYGQAFGTAFQILDDLKDGDFNRASSSPAKEVVQKYIIQAQTSLKALPHSRVGLSAFTTAYQAQALL